MPAPTPPGTLPAVPDTPNRLEGQDTFNTKAFAWNDWFAPFTAWLETVVTFITTSNTWAESQAIAAESSATAASESEDAAEGFAYDAAASAASALSSPGTNATSTSTFTPAFGSNSFTLAQTGKNFVVDQFVTVVNSANPANSYFNGVITAFNSGTGAITVYANDVRGAASSSTWTITPAPPSYGEKFTSPVQVFVAKGTTGGSVTADMRAGLWQALTTNANTTFTFTEPDIATSSTISWIVLDITKGGSHTLTFPGGTIWSDGAQPTHNSGARFQYFGTKTGTGSWVFSAARKNIS